VHLVSDTGAGVRVELLSRADWRRGVEQLVSRYRALDVGNAEVRALEIIALSERLAQAGLTWALFKRHGDALYEFNAFYTLICEGTSCGVVAIAHDELLRSRQGTAQTTTTDDSTCASLRSRRG
jgi:hypothetical protein